MLVTLAEGQRVGNYLLTRRIAAGACGEVWLGRHHAWADKLVAVKVPNDPQYVRSLQKDGAAMHGLRHPCIVDAVDFDPYADPPYLAMEYVPGSSLRPLIQGRKLGVLEAVAILRQVLAALGHAHSRGVVHRDIKPENILVHERASRDGFFSEGVVKVTDFGLGRVGLSNESMAFSTSLSSADARHMAGTLAYMAPEQREGLPADARADLYACGVVFFEMLTGRKPHGADLPSKANATVPKYLDEAFRRAYGWLDERYASAAEFNDALTKVTVPRAVPPPLPAACGAPPIIPTPPVPPARHAPLSAEPAVWTNSLGMTFVRIEPGTFMMGSTAGEEGRSSNETPHRVTLSKPHYLGKHHVTRGQFARFAAETRYRTDAEKAGHSSAYNPKNDSYEDVKGASWQNPGFAQADDHPVVLVSWNDAVAFTEWLGRKAGGKYHLPTEAQWEFACRNNSGDTKPFNTGETISTGQANYDGNHTYGRGVKGVYRKGTTPVGTFPPNARGLHDMHGNAWQWCSDIYGPYPSGATIDPTGVTQDGDTSGVPRVLRGGAWSDNPDVCRSASRDDGVPYGRTCYIGFRVVMET